MELKNIIVPIDFSEESLKGLELALLFSRHTFVNIQMVYVQKKSGDYYPSSVEAESEYAESAFNKIIEKYTPLLQNGSKLRYIIKKGKIFKEVVSQAESYKDSLITASTHGASGFEELFIGSNAYKIISATERPVITLRKGKCPEKVGIIVLPIDQGDDTRQKVPLTTELARIFNAEVHIVTVNTMKDEKAINRLKAYQTQVAGYLTGKVIIKTTDLFGDNAADLVIDYAKSVGANLISITTDQSSGLNLILGNLAHQVINKSEIPVLSITPREIRSQDSLSTQTGLV
jgi:nucleotide-binding universal stress UspA family protein